jgi:hypothetical protein
VDSLIINEFDKDHLIKEYMYIKSNKFDANIGHNGVILFNRAKAIFNNNNCWNNTAYYNGCLSNGGKLITHANNFRNNHVVKCGLIYNWNLLDSSKDYYNNNTARYGGCIYNTGNASIANTLMKFSQAVNASTIYNTGNMNIAKSNINKNIGCKTHCTSNPSESQRSPRYSATGAPLHINEVPVAPERGCRCKQTEAPLCAYSARHGA